MRTSVTRSSSPILASGKNGGRLGNYGDPVAAMNGSRKGWLCRPSAQWSLARRVPEPATAWRIIQAYDDNLVRSHSSLGRARQPSSQGQWENGPTSPRPENGEQVRSASGAAIRWRPRRSWPAPHGRRSQSPHEPLWRHCSARISVFSESSAVFPTC
jgi:hypothetical protein